jgi:hypothetical protein
MKQSVSSFILVGLAVGLSCSSVLAKTSDPVFNTAEIGKFDFHASILYLQPTNNDLKYAVFVFNTQPYSQDWAYQILNPSYSPAFDIVAGYAFKHSPYRVSVDWLHFHSSDSSSKQANPIVSLANVQFVAPPYDVGPAVFGIKHASSSVVFNANDVGVHAARAFEFDDGMFQMSLFGGVNFLHVKQDTSTTFSDYPGALPTSVTYATAPDPIYSFRTDNKSQYVGAGPDFGINVLFKMKYGFSLVTQAQAMLTAGNMSARDNFTSVSTRLKAVGIPQSQQYISSPNRTQVVPGFDTKLGLQYQFTSNNQYHVMIEGGYRVAEFVNAITAISPGSLVQVGQNIATPEFATGTMAIQSTDTRQSTLGLNGLYLDIKLEIN